MSGLRKTSCLTGSSLYFVLTMTLACLMSFGTRRGHAEPVPPGVREAAPVLGRIIEKSVQSAEVRLESLQWAYIEHRGLLFLGKVNLAQFQLETVAEEELSPDDIAWDNARREVLVPAEAE